MTVQNSINQQLRDGFTFILGSDASGDIYYNDGSKLARLAAGSEGQILVVNSGLPSWSTGAPPGGSAGGDLTGTYPNPSIGNDVVTFAKLQNVATASFVGRNSSGSGDPEQLNVATVQSMLGLGSAAYLAVGTGANQIPQLDGSGKLATSVVPAIAFNEVFVVSDQAGRLALSAAIGDIAKQTDNGLAYMLQSLPASTDGNWVTIGDTTIDAADIVSGTIGTGRLGSGTANSGTYLRGDQTWAAIAYQGLPTTEVSGTSQALDGNRQYIVDSASLSTLTLPATCAVGEVIKIVGKGSGGWRLSQPSGDQVHFGDVSTTSGTAGRIDSTHRRDCLEIICITADSEWQVVSAIGNLEVT